MWTSASMEQGPSKNDYRFVWLDETVKSNRDNKDLSGQINQKTCGRLKTFVEPDECASYILTSTDDRIVFIVSGRFGQQVVPVVHDWDRIERIYVYCGDRAKAEQWSRDYRKVICIFTSSSQLLRQIKRDMGLANEDHQLEMSVFNLEEKESSLSGLSSESANFMWSQSAILAVRSMGEGNGAKRDMVAESLTSYATDELEKNRIKRFDEEFVPEKAFEWYTRDSFVYRLLNQALRTRNCEVIFRFRYFINKLHEQIDLWYKAFLKTPLSSSDKCLIVYRGQQLSMNEVELMRRSTNQLISMNSFLSATRDIETAKMFADNTNSNGAEPTLEAVVFTIRICNMSSETTPFAFVEQLSCCPGEEEVLFTIGAIFEVKEVKFEDKFWRVQLELSKKQDNLGKELEKYIQRHIGKSSSTLLLGWYLYRMNNFNEARRFAELLLKQMKGYPIVVGDAHNLLGLIYKDSGQLEMCIGSYRSALDFYQTCQFLSAERIVITGINLSLAYLTYKRLSDANRQQRTTEEQFRKLPSESRQRLDLPLRSLNGKIQIARGDYTSAVLIIEPILRQKRTSMLGNHPSTAGTLIDMGVVHERLGHDQKAMKYFEEAFAIYDQSLPNEHLDRAECLEHMARLNEKLGRPDLAAKQNNSAFNMKKNITRPLITN